MISKELLDTVMPQRGLFFNVVPDVLKRPKPIVPLETRVEVLEDIVLEGVLNDE